MKPVLILYATRQGQTQRIADHLASEVRARGVPAAVVDAAHPEGLALDAYSAAILCASVHLGRHEREMVAFVKSHRDGLRQMPSVFVSVSLSQAGVQDSTWPPERRAQAAADTGRMIQKFISQSGWSPGHVLAAAGALRYREYNWFLRIAMRRIARTAGAPTDASQDYEFTDWNALDHLAEELVAELLGEEALAARSHK
jgi:menaquinone-dependent protoporphyrinogen oxidase